MLVTVIDRTAQDKAWGRTQTSIQNYLRTITIADTCPTCGGPRGEPRMARQCDDGEWFNVSRWENPCGHIDRYADVLREVAA